MTISITKRSFQTPLMVWFSVVLFYLYQYIIRVSPSVMTDEIMGAFSIDAHAFGTLTAVATYCYAFLQIPAGVLADLFGTRRILLLSIAACTSGLLIFTLTDQLAYAYFGRILIGCGSACSFLCLSKVAHEWFAPRRRALMFSAAIVMGTLGAILGGMPLATLNHAIGWRSSLLLLVGFGGIVFLLNFLFVRRSSVQEDEVSFDFNRTKKEILGVFQSKICWLYAMVALGSFLAVSVFADLWGVAFLTLKYGLTKETSAQFVSLIYIGLCIGTFAAGVLASRMRDIRPVISLIAVGGAVILSLVVFFESSSLFALALMMLVMGLAAGGEILCFTGACQQMPVAVSGTITGFLNCAVTLGAAEIQRRVGALLNYFWDGTRTLDKLPVYTIEDYQSAFSLVILIMLVSFVFTFFLDKETIRSPKESETAV